MTEQIPLTGLEPPPTLTAQQAAVYDALKAAGGDGLRADEAGAIAHEIMDSKWAHPRDQRCKWCGARGLQILKRLRDLKLARYRAKLKGWQAVGYEIVSAEDETQDEQWQSLLDAGF